MNDHVEIANLIYTYAERIDLGDFAGVGQLFEHAEVTAEPGETARTRSYFTVFMQTDTLALQPIIAGRYHDEFRKIDGVWCFTRRHMITDLVGDLSEHLLLSLG